MPNLLESIQLGRSQFTIPKIETDVGVPAIFTKVTRLTILRRTNQVLLTSFALDQTGVVTAQKDLEDRPIDNAASLDFRLVTDNRGMISRAYAYWHTIYSPPFVAALGSWPKPFPLEYAGYDNNQNGQFHACLGFAGKIERRDPYITATMSSTNVTPGTNSFSYSVWSDNEIAHLVLWLEQNQSGTAELGGKKYVL